MAFTYDTTTNAGMVRLIIMDREKTNAIFNDSEIDAFLSISSDSVLRASAMALRAIAANQLLVLKVIKLLQLQTDGAAVAREFRLEADKLDDKADFIDASLGGNFDIAEYVDDVFAQRERLEKEILRTYA